MTTPWVRIRSASAALAVDGAAAEAEGVVDADGLGSGVGGADRSAAVQPASAAITAATTNRDPTKDAPPTTEREYRGARASPRGVAVSSPSYRFRAEPGPGAPHLSD